MRNEQNKKGKKKNAYLLLLLVLLLGITVGFATLSATLTINGTSTINGNTQWDVSPDPSDPDKGVECPQGTVCTINPQDDDPAYDPDDIFPDDGVTPNPENCTDPEDATTCSGPFGAIIWTDGDTVRYKHLFVEPGETFTFDVTFKNTGTIEAELQSAVTGALSATAAKYLTYEVKYADGTTPTAGDKLAAGASKTYRVTLTYNDYVETAGQPGSLPSPEEIAIINAEEHTFTATYVQA